MKNKILDISLRQFLLHGIRKMSVQKLVEPLNISTKTFYKYFKNKEDLLKGALISYYDLKYRTLESDAEGHHVVHVLCNIWNGAMEAELNVNQKFFQDLLYYYPELNEKFTAKTNLKFLKPFIRIIERGIDEGVFREEIIPEVVLDCMFVLYMSIVRKRDFKRFSLDFRTLLLNTMIVYIRGICTEKGSRELNEHIKSFKTSQGARITRKLITTNHLNK